MCEAIISSSMGKKASIPYVKQKGKYLVVILYAVL